MIKATLEINGKNATISGDYNGSVQAFLGYPGIANQQSHEVADGSSNSLLLVVSDANAASIGNIPFTIDVPLVFTFDSSDIGWGQALFHSGGLSTALSLGPTQLIYQFPSTAAAPEPSTWAMMLLGFSGLGVFGYRKARRLQSA
jgi:hypothetical protein